MDNIFHSCTVISNEEVGAGVRHLIISRPEKLIYEAGQFFMLRLQDAKGTPVERSYSVANYDDSGKLEFVIRIEAQGQMTSLIDTLKEGDTIDLKGPFGRFGFGVIPQDMEKLVLIAGGVGISPLRSMVQKSFGREDSFPLQLFYGFRTADDFLFKEELMALSTQERFSIITAMSEASDTDPSAPIGYISDFLEGQVFTPDANTHACICGPPPMVKATRAKLYELGYGRGNVHVEAW